MSFAVIVHWSWFISFRACQSIKTRGECISPNKRSPGSFDGSSTKANLWASGFTHATDGKSLRGLLLLLTSAFPNLLGWWIVPPVFSPSDHYPKNSGPTFLLSYPETSTMGMTDPSKRSIKKLESKKSSRSPFFVFFPRSTLFERENHCLVVLKTSFFYSFSKIFVQFPCVQKWSRIPFELAISHQIIFSLVQVLENRAAKVAKKL